MEQAQHFVCEQCATAVPSGHKFCGACGATVPAEFQTLETQYYGAMQTPGKARLIVIRGDQGVGEGLSFLLQASEHVLGRDAEQIPFPTDRWLDPKHANFFYRGGHLVVRDEASTNGVYVRIRGTGPIEPGGQFICGEQVFRLEATPKDTSGPDPDETYFYSSPKRPSSFRITHLLAGGVEGSVCCARDNVITIGREGCDINFPTDVRLSPVHARVEMVGSAIQLVDTESQNGVFVQIQGEQQLAHGDYLFVGKQLLRVEITA